MTAGPACIFCQIVAGQAPASFVYRDDTCAAFMDIRPVTAGHVLVVPNAHFASLAQVPPETAGRLMQMAQRVAAALRRSGLPCDGVNLFLADGEAAGQDVFHAHLHVFPRYAGDGFGLRLPPDYSQKPRAALDAAAEAIRRGL